MDADSIPADLVEAAGYAIFAEEQCDKRQAQDVPYQWDTRLNEVDHREYRSLARAALAAVYGEIQARALEGIADELLDLQCGGHYNPATCETCRVVEGLREDAAYLRTPDTGQEVES